MGKNTFLKSTLLLIVISFIISPTVVFAEDPSHDDHGHHGIGAEELVRGERLFFGLINKGENTVNCASCHNTRFSESFNWNPDAFEISVKYADLSADDLIKVIQKPRGQKLSESHKDFDFTEEEIILIKAYMDVVAEEGLVIPKPVINKLLVFIFMFVLILFSLADLIVLRKLKRKWIHLIIILVAALYITKTLAHEAIAIGRSENYSPDQPIKFSHAIHAGENKTNCLYCHPSAEYSKSAGIPGANVCMNCHLIVRNGTNSGTWEINKLIESYENNIAIEWIRIHNNPDHVFFSHAQHVSVGGVECQECHGEVETMDRVIQVSDLSMGWCIECHRERELNFHSNDFYSNYEMMKDKVKKGEVNKVTIEKLGGIECMKCHY